MRFLSFILCLALLCSMAPAVLAGDQVSAAEPQAVAETPQEPEAAPEEAVQEPEALPDDTPQEQAPEEAPQEPEEAPADIAVMGGMGSAEQLELPGTDTYDMFTTRPLAACETIRKGIDVSEWNGTIDWKAVKASGVDFAIIRAAGRGWAAEGRMYSDSNFKTNLEGAKAAGLKVGVYIFSQAITRAEAQAEAELLIKSIKGYQIDLPLVMDYEYAGAGQGGRLYGANLSRRAATDICNAFCDTCANAGYESMVYCNYNMLVNKMYADELNRVWLAHYARSTDYPGRYEYWQCSSAGLVSGISGRVDLNFWFDPKGVEGAPPFLDVPASAWYLEDLKSAYNLGVIQGFDATTFGPGLTLTRAQMVTMLYRMEGKPAVTTTSPFLDATTGYFVDAVNWAWSTDAVKGTTETTFSPDENMTREQLVTVLYRMAGEPEVTGTMSDFTDQAKISNFARNAMVWAVNLGLIRGFEDKTLQPQGNVTRAQACAILMRYRN